MISHLRRILAWVAKPVSQVQPEERTKTAIMFSYFFLVIALIYILKPVRNSLFLGELGARNLPFAYMGEAVFLIFVVIAYVQFAKFVPKRIFYAGMLGFFASNLVLFWLLFQWKVPYLAAFFYIWVASFSITMTTQFWTLANDLFNPLEAKRLFGLIISGGSAGGILGGLATSQLVRWIKTEDLLLVAAGVLLLCMHLLGVLWKKIPEAESAAPEKYPVSENGMTPESAQAGDGSVPKIFFGSSYLLMLAGIVMIAKIASAVVDNQFNGIVELSIAHQESRTAFFGGFMSGLNALSFLMQFFLTSFCLRRLGIGFSLWILPLGLLLFSSGGLIFPVLWLGLFLKLFDGSVNYSIQQASKEALYLPLSSAVRYRVKPVIDMLGFRVAKFLGGFYIAMVGGFLKIPVEKLGALVILLLPLWVLIVIRMRRGYSELLRSHLVNGKQHRRAVAAYKATDVLSFLHEEKDFEEIHSFISSKSTYTRKLAAAAYLTYAGSARDLELTRKAMSQIVSTEPVSPERISFCTGNGCRDAQFLAAFVSLHGHILLQRGEIPEGCLKDGSFGEALIKVGNILKNPKSSYEIKSEAIGILGYLPRQETIDLLTYGLRGIKDHSFRFMMIKAMERIRRKEPSLKIHRNPIRNEIIREVESLKTIHKLRNYYGAKTRGKKTEDYLDVALCAIRDENWERLFKYLKLLCQEDVLDEILDEIMRYSKNDEIPAHAVELLTNTLPPDLLSLTDALFEREDGGLVGDDEFLATVKDFCRSEDRWFILIAGFLVKEMRLDKRRPDFFPDVPTTSACPEPSPPVERG